MVDPDDGLQNPFAIFEVLGPTTAAFDRGEKFEYYQRLPSLEHYVLIEQDRVSVTHYEKLASNLWAIVGLHTSLSDALTLRLGNATIAVPLTRIYRRIALPNAEETNLS